MNNVFYYSSFKKRIVFLEVLFFVFIMICTNTTAEGYIKTPVVAKLLQQDLTVTGIVTDANGIVLPGVNILVKGTYKGTTTDLNGTYSIVVPEDGILQFSFIGYVTREISVNGEKEINVILDEEMESIGDVVIVAYGRQKKETVTGALSSISSEELVRQPVSDITQALAGRLPGLISINSGGRPGKDVPSIKIRGIATLDAGSGSNPLIMIDGIERDQTSLSFLDPNEIESLSILKDASSTAVFGVRGANGVILVTTKRGKDGPAQINYSSNIAFMVPTFKLDLVDSYVQTGLANEFLGFDANSTNPAALYSLAERERYKGVVEGNPVDPNDVFFYPNTDYEDLLIKNYAMQQQHNFTISGGTDVVKYFASLGYFDQGGLFNNINPEIDKSTSYKRYNYRSNIDVNITKSTLVKINIGGNYNRNICLGQAGIEPSYSFYHNLLQHSGPWDGYVYDGKVVFVKDNVNSVMTNSDMRGYNLEMQHTSDFSFILDQKLDFITDGLSIKGTASFISYFNNFVSRAKDEKAIPMWNPYLEDGNVVFYQNKEDVLPYNTTSQNKRRKNYYELALNYTKSINNIHNISVLGLVNADKSYYSEYYWNDIPRSYLGTVGRITYNYMNRYMAEFNAGYNGSENFAKGKRFGFFPAYSLGWSFTEEPWINKIIGDRVLSYGKFRFSYGVVGNDKIGNRFLYLPDKYVMGQYFYSGWCETGVIYGLPGAIQEYPIAYQGAAGNPNVTWEKSTKINFGTDLVFLNDNINLKFDYFTEDRTDILITQNVVPIYQQTGSLALNLGHVENRGFEIELGIKKKTGPNSRIWVDMNYSFARNKILEMDEPEQPYEYMMQTGRRVGEIWGYMQDGFFMTETEADAYKEELWQTYLLQNPGADKSSYQAYQLFNTGYDVSAGDIKFIDRNGDGLINSNDEGYLDMVNFPESMFALNLGFQYKGFSASLLLQGATNYSINSRTNRYPMPAKASIPGFVLNRYTPERYEAGETIEYPRLVNTNDNWKYNGTYWIKDATYIRVKNFELSYTLNSTIKFIDAIGFDNIRVYANGLNLFTLSKIKTIDPETSDGVLQYPRNRVFNLGISAQF